MQELLLPEQPAAAYVVSGLITSHKGIWNLPGTARNITLCQNITAVDRVYVLCAMHRPSFS